MKEQLTKLINVKSIITFAIVGVLCYLSVVGKIEAKEFLSLATMVVVFYFGTQNGKKEKEEENKNNTK